MHTTWPVPSRISRFKKKKKKVKRKERRKGGKTKAREKVGEVQTKRFGPKRTGFWHGKRRRIKWILVKRMDDE